MSDISTLESTATVPLTNRAFSWIGLFGRLVIVNGLFIGVTLVYFVVHQMLFAPLANLQSHGFVIMSTAFLFSFVPVIFFGILVNCFYVVARYHRTSHPILAVSKEFWRFISDRNRLLLGVPLLSIMFIFLYFFMEIKSNIPLVAPFSWDLYLYKLDKAIHFGIDPWQIVHPFFQMNDYLLLILNVNYHIWFLFMWLCFSVYAFSSSFTVNRTRFLLAVFLTWPIGGSLLAIIFSSAGPAFFSDIGLTPDPYAPLMQHLTEVNKTLPITAIDLQRMLWDNYAFQNNNLGISAMPSMHNALALLVALGAWRLNRTAGFFMYIHVFLVYIGSFYLGWHYAIDAYLGWAVTLAMWWISGPIARWWHGLPAIKAFGEQLDNDTINNGYKRS